MEIISSLENIRDGLPCSLALGAFDGLHRGHMAVIKAACGAEGLVPGVFTFASAPKGAPALLTPEDKLLLLEKAGIRQVCQVDFASLCHMEAERFVREVLFQRLHAVRLCCGEDFLAGRPL